MFKVQRPAVQMRTAYQKTKKATKASGPHRGRQKPSWLDFLSSTDSERVHGLPNKENLMPDAGISQKKS
jgi:hypothetical protein